MAEVRIIVSGIDPSIVKIIFCFRENKYNLRNFKEIKQEKISAVRFGLETTLYYASQLSTVQIKN